MRQQADCVRHGAPPQTRRGLRPCDPEKPSYEKKTSDVHLPPVGRARVVSVSMSLNRCFSRPRVTFLSDPTDTRFGYIFK